MWIQRRRQSKKKLSQTAGSICLACSSAMKGTGMYAKRARKYAVERIADHRATRFARVICGESDGNEEKVRR
jgi:hypothetical protein